MSLTKYASLESAEVLELKSSPTRVKQASLDKLSDFNDYRTEDGYLYARIRAISSRVNKNHDGWPTIELAGGHEAWEREASRHEASSGFSIQASKGEKYGFSTFLGKPHFVDHHNSNPDRARGVVVDASFHVLDQKTAAAEDDYWGSDKVDPEHFPPAEIELLIEVDAESFPKLAKAIVNGDIDGFSMGCDVDYSKCSHCGHKASSPDEYCTHVQAKGGEFDFTSADGKVSSRKSYENCYGIKFFEISAVFDPADETALAKEVRSEERQSKTAETFTPMSPMLKFQDPNYVPTPEEYEELRRLEQKPPATYEGIEQTERENQRAVEESWQGGYPSSGLGRERGHDEYGIVHAPKAVRELAPHPNSRGVIQPAFVPNDPHSKSPFYRGSYLQAKAAAIKLAQPDEPQVDHTHAPEEVNTMREEKVCPLCGSDMEDGKCAVCGFEEPPESLQNPNLDKAKEQVEDLQAAESEQLQPPGPNTPAVDPDAETYLNARNTKPASTVNSEMRWVPTIELPKKSASEPKGDEPDETVISDQTDPVVAAFRTAKEMIQAANRNHKDDNMSDDVTKVAADPADPSARADKRVDVTGTGGVADATAEQASKADAQVDVEGKGGVLDASNAEASAPDKNESLPSGEQDNAGFQSGGETGDPTKTFDNSNEPDSAVTDKAFPTSANKGTQPADPVGKADDRIDVEQPPHDQIGDKTKTWSGTDGNGVTRQQDAVTNVPTQSGGIKASGTISLAALRLADAEVELGLIGKDEKYNRLAALAEVPEDEIVAEHRALAKVKTANLTRTASKGGVSRLPSFQRVAAEETPEAAPINDALLDSALYN